MQAYYDSVTLKKHVEENNIQAIIYDNYCHLMTPLEQYIWILRYGLLCNGMERTFKSIARKFTSMTNKPVKSPFIMKIFDKVLRTICVEMKRELREKTS